MRTALISDLHLGQRHDADLLRAPALRERLLAALAGSDRVVLLGDALELRDRPMGEVIELARPFFAELGAALDGAEVVLVGGNHDHRLLLPLLDRRRVAGRGALGLEQIQAPATEDPAGRLAESMGSTPLLLGYPGVWVRPDVFAIHGHYVDRHVTVPTFERVIVAAIERVVGELPARRATPADYETALAPLYDVVFTLAQIPRKRPGAPGSDLSIRVWRRLHHGGGRNLSGRALQGAIFAAIAACHAAGLGPFESDLSGDALRRSGLQAMAQVAKRLGIEAEHVIFGHTHRAGPFPGDGAGWAPPGGPRLTNTGSWVFQRHFLTETPGASPYWPGNVVFVDDEGPPRIERLLTDLSLDELGAVGAAV